MYGFNATSSSGKLSSYWMKKNFQQSMSTMMANSLFLIRRMLLITSSKVVSIPSFLRGSCLVLDPAACPLVLYCSEQEVYELLTNLDHGSDGISARWLKGTTISIAPVLTMLFNHSIQTGKLPSAWKNYQTSCQFQLVINHATTDQFLSLAKCWKE